MSALIEPEPQRRLLTVDEVLRMVEVGILDEDDRVELIEGELLQMSPIGLPHMHKVNWLNRAFVRAAGDDGLVSIQNSLKLSNITLPQPDVVLLRAEPDEYRRRHPKIDEVVLLIEVAESSFSYDRRCKAALYARHGIAEYWIVHVEKSRVLRLTEPTQTGYAKEETIEGRVAPLALPSCVVDLAPLFD